MPLSEFGSWEGVRGCKQTQAVTESCSQFSRTDTARSYQRKDDELVQRASIGRDGAAELVTVQAQLLQASKGADRRGNRA